MGAMQHTPADFDEHERSQYARKRTMRACDTVPAYQREGIPWLNIVDIAVKMRGAIHDY